MRDLAKAPSSDSPRRARVEFVLTNLCLGLWLAGLLFGVVLGGAIHLLLVLGMISLFRLERSERLTTPSGGAGDP